MAEAYDLRARWKRIHPVLDELDQRDREAYFDQPIGERILQTIRLSEAAIRNHPEHLDEPDDEHLVWKRVRDRLHGNHR